MYVSQWITSQGVPITPVEFTQWLASTAHSMYSRGWDVIGSFCKTPNLRPWKHTTRDQLQQWAQMDIAAGRSNSLNLRLQGTGVIALDCDFHDPSLMNKFVSDLSAMLSIRRQYFYTCKGAKGGKIFFRYSSRGVDDTPPKRIGPIAYSAGFAGVDSAKQELEIKTDLSTVAGLYGKVELTDNQGNQYPDAIVYSAYDGCRSILEASPCDLQVLSKRDIEAIEDLYLSILQQGRFIEKCGVEISPKNYEQLNIAASAAYVMRIALKQQNGFDATQLISDLAHDEGFNSLIEPFYTYLHLDSALSIIRLLNGKAQSSEGLKDWERDAAKYLYTLIIHRKIDSLASIASSFIHLTKKNYQRLQQDAQSKGLIQESMKLDCFELFSLLNATNRGDVN